jgi:hypothetical protein
MNSIAIRQAKLVKLLEIEGYARQILSRLEVTNHGQAPGETASE